MNLETQLLPQRVFSIALCVFALVAALFTTYAVSRGASTGELPLPVDVPLPDTVFHDDRYGTSMAIDGDTLVVGAPWTKVNGLSQQGVVYIFTRNGDNPTAFTLLKSITGSDSGKGDAFGWSVSLEGDTLVVGTGEVGDVHSLGGAYLFQRDQGGAGNWGEVKKLLRADGRELTYLGRAVALHGDTVAVAAPLGLGQVFLFARNQGGANQWGQTQMLDGGIPITTTPRSASFGHVVAFAGDRLLISAPKVGLQAADVPSGSPAPARNFEGATFVYRQENRQWVQEAKLFPGNLDLNKLDQGSVFGGLDAITSLASNGDTLFVGLPFGTTDDEYAGRVLVFQRGAGTLGPYGLPGGWGEVAQLTPSDGVDNDHFGRALYAVDDGLFVSSEKQGVGKIYFFLNPAGSLNGGAVEAQALLSWSEVYSFSTSTDGSSTDFGMPVTGSDNTVVMGDQSGNGGRGGLVAYAKDALFAADPNATPTPSPTPPPTETPAPSAPCVAAQTHHHGLFLPLIAGADPASIVAVSAPQPQAESTPFVGNLGPECVVSGPGGVKLGAVAGAITQTIGLTIENVTAPAEALPDGATPAGDFLRITSATNRHVAMDTPFVIALPVPSNVDATHLVLLPLLPATDTLESNATGVEWGYLPGVYDAPSGLFLARLPFLLAGGTTFVLAEHPDFESPANQPPTAVNFAATTANGEFHLFCIHATFANAGDCTAAMEADAKTVLDGIYQRMTDPAIFGYPRKLRLLDSGSQFIVSDAFSVTAESVTYAAYIFGPNSPSCTGALGKYNKTTGMLKLCLSPGASIDADGKDTLIHEFFHAIEYTYPAVWEDYDLYGFDEDWITEGMAEAAVKSYPGTNMQRSPYYGVDNLHKVDLPLTIGKNGDLLEDEYLAQDFWVYVGASLGKGLEYLGPMLATGGATTTGMDAAFHILYGKSLDDFYWAWVKNQSVENALNIGVGPGKYCTLSPNALVSGVPANFPVVQQVFPFGTPFPFDTLPALTAKVIELDFGSKPGGLVMMQYEGCTGLQDPVAEESCVNEARKTLKNRLYTVDGTAQCDSIHLPDTGETQVNWIDQVDPTKHYYMVVANTDSDESHAYSIAIE